MIVLRLALRSLLNRRFTALLTVLALIDSPSIDTKARATLRVESPSRKQLRIARSTACDLRL